LKIRVISSKQELDKLNSEDEIIHLSFRASYSDIFRLLQNCPQIKAIQLPASHSKKLSKASRMFLEMQGVTIIEGDLWGHRKDLDEYFKIGKNVFDIIDQMQAGGMATNEIARRVSIMANISPNLVKYVIQGPS